MTRREATEDQSIESWVKAHEGMATYFKGSSEIWVPDNLKSGVDGADRYEPGINRTYKELSSHYGAVVIPARVAKPKDKAKVESAVQVAQRWILAVLRHHTFFRLSELNEAIREQLERLNARPMQKLGVSRRELAASWKSSLQSLRSVVETGRRLQLRHPGPVDLAVTLKARVLAH